MGITIIQLLAENYPQETFICMFVSLFAIIVLLMLLWNKSKKYNKSLSSLVDKQIDERRKHEAEVTSIQQKSNALIAEEKRQSISAIEAEKKRSAEELEKERELSRIALEEEKKRSRDALIALREQIKAEEAELNKLPEKDLVIKTIMALSGYGSRLDRIEALYNSIYENVSATMMETIRNEFIRIMSSFRDTSNEIINAVADSNTHSIQVYEDKLSELMQSVSNIGTMIDTLSESVNDVIGPYDDSNLMNSINNIESQVEYIYQNTDDNIEDIVSSVQYIKENLCSDCDNSNIVERLDGISESISSLDSRLDSLGD